MMAVQRGHDAMMPRDPYPHRTNNRGATGEEGPGDNLCVAPSLSQEASPFLA
jgi:hypothetical protein